MRISRKNLLLTASLLIALRWVFGEDAPSSAMQQLQQLDKADSVVSIAREYLGTPYRYGSTAPEKGFDCSGFVWVVMKKAGVAVPRSSRGYAGFGEEIPLEECRKGDVLVFSATNNSQIGHVGIVISEEGEPVRFIHASSSKKHPGVVITDYNKSWYIKRFKFATRVL